MKNLAFRVPLYFGLQIAIIILGPLAFSEVWRTFFGYPERQFGPYMGGQFSALFLAYCFSVPCLLYLGYHFARSLRDPTGRLARASLGAAGPRVTSVAEALCRRLSIRTTPRLFAILEPLCFSLGTENRSSIFLWNGIEEMSSGKVESILAHESWHVKSDLETATCLTSDNVLASIIFVVMLFAFFQILFLANIASIATLGSSGILAYVSIAAGWAAVSTFFGAFCAVCFVAAARMSIVWKNPYREFFADCLGSVSTDKPRVMASAIWDMAKISVESTNSAKSFKSYLRLNLTGLRETATPEEKFRSWSTIFEGIKLRQTHPPVFRRLALLYLLQYVMDDSASIVIRKTVDPNLIGQAVFWLGNPLSPTYNAYYTFGNVFRQIGSKQKTRLWEYMKANQRELNLRKAAFDCSIRLEETVSFFFLLVAMKAIEVKTPTLDLYSIRAFSKFGSSN